MTHPKGSATTEPKGRPTPKRSVQRAARRRGMPAMPKLLVSASRVQHAHRHGHHH